MKKPVFDDHDLAGKALDAVRQDRNLWNHTDPYLLALIDCLRSQLREAAISLGLTWNEKWRDSDILLIAETYKRKERMRDD